MSEVRLGAKEDGRAGAGGALFIFRPGLLDCGIRPAGGERAVWACGACGERPAVTARRNAADLVKSDSEEIAWTNSARAVLGHCSLGRPWSDFFFKSRNFRFLLSPFSAQISQSFRVKNSQMRGLRGIFRCCAADTYSV